MTKPPDAWQRAQSERLTKLGALVTRRKVLLADLAETERLIEGVQDEILSLERTQALAAEVAGATPANGVDHGAPARP